MFFLQIVVTQERRSFFKLKKAKYKNILWSMLKRQNGSCEKDRANGSERRRGREEERKRERERE